MKYNKFYFTVLKAFNELIEIVHNKVHIEILDWPSMIAHLQRIQSKLLININETPNAMEKDNFDKKIL